MKIITQASEKEINKRSDFTKTFKTSPIPDNELLMNLALYLPRQYLTHILYMDYLYRKQIKIYGDIMEFGCRFGRNLALFQNLRGIYEPFNYTRRIIGFDTFTGFMVDSDKDIVKKGDYSTPKDYEHHLREVLDYHCSNSPIPHIKKDFIVKGDIAFTLEKYLKDNPETFVSLVYFDMDLYKPTRDALEIILPYLVKGCVVAFDELKCDKFPDETRAFKEFFNINKTKIRKYRYDSLRSYFIFGE